MDSLGVSSPPSGVSQSFTYNNMWQLTGDGVRQYVYPAGHNNGRISQLIDGLLGQTINYTYDSLNRLSTAQATNNAWGQAYSYDGFGNLTAKTVTAGSAMQFSASYNGATNQQAGITYDANGNSSTGAYDPVNQQYLTYQYDVENRIVSASDSGETYNYGYDPQGKRVMAESYYLAGSDLLSLRTFTLRSDGAEAEHV
jgi:YD repeat-containing protein